ncbi:MAG TPA: uL22 family ribosomal protein [Patescibacteria group bacterium]
MANTVKKTTTTRKAAPAKVQTVPEVVKAETVRAVYNDKNIKISPRKLRLLANTIKKLSPVVALSQIQFVNTKSARVLSKALKTAIANAKNNYGLNADTLKFDQILVNEGMKIKRMDKGHGARFARGLIMKRHSRLNIVLKGDKI